MPPVNMRRAIVSNISSASCHDHEGIKRKCVLQIGGPLLEAADFKPTHPGSNAALLHIAKAGMDCSAGQWPDWAVMLRPSCSCRGSYTNNANMTLFVPALGQK